MWDGRHGARVRPPELLQERRRLALHRAVEPHRAPIVPQQQQLRPVGLRGGEGSVAGAVLVHEERTECLLDRGLDRGVIRGLEPRGFR